MKALDDVEALARWALSRFPSHEYASPAAAMRALNTVRADREPELARVLLAVLPTIRAAIELRPPDLAMPKNGDWACVECRPYSDCLIDGFRCRQHTLLGAIDNLRQQLGGE